MKEFILNKIRVQLLSEDIVRVERAGGNGFSDGNTYFVPDRNFQGFDGKLSKNKDGDFVIDFKNCRLTVPANGRMRGVRLSCQGESVYTYKPLKNSGELPLPFKTPKVFALSDCPRITIPAEGYVKGAKYLVEEDTEDIYLLVCGGDHKKLRSLYVTLTGRSEMVRMSTLGFWNSRYFKHDDASARALIEKFKENDIPLDNMVLDTDWRKTSDRGIGYETDTALFPDMRGFFSFAHGNGVEIMFNDHPEPVEGASDLFDGKEIEYRHYNLGAHLKDGLDYWWYDRNWHTKLKSPAKGVNPESLGMYLFRDITKSWFAEIYGSPCRRPVIMGNADNISNGNYVKINDSASHRYSVQWTGDIPSDESSIAAEIKNMLLAENNCITYINSDCGGHTGNPTKEEYIRWMQFGAFSPVFRPHCTMGVTRFREPWCYDGQTLGIVRAYIKMRYRLLPEIYKNAYLSYLNGQPLFKSLSYDYPDDKKARAVYDEYLLGDGILVAPMHGVQAQKVEAKNYISPVTAVYYDGIERKGEPIYETKYNRLDIYLNHVPPAPEVPVYNFSAVFETDLLFDKRVELIVGSDDGVTVYVDGVKTLEDNSFHSEMKMKAGVLEANVPHHIRLEYFQGGGEASIALFYLPAQSECNLSNRRVYLPEGEWVDAFSGKVLRGAKTIGVSCPLEKMPLYVKRGAVIPLIAEAQNTKLQNRENIVYDFYPSKEGEYESFLYEDDMTTLAYTQGVWRKTPFSSRYEVKEGCVCLKIGKAEGGYSDGLTKRNVTVKYHLLKGTEGVKEVTVNGISVPFKITKRNEEELPFSTALSSCQGATLTVQFVQPLLRETEIKFILT